MAGIDINRFVNSLNSRLEPPLKSHLKSVYTCLAISTLVAGAGAYVHVFTDFLQGGLLTSIAALAFMIALQMTKPDGAKNQNMRLGMLLGFAFCSGLGLGPLINMAISIDPSIITTAFLGTSLVFVCFTLASMFSDQQKFLAIGGTLMSVLSVMLLLSLANIFLGSRLLFQAHLYIGLAVFCAFILYDTQAILEKKRRGDNDYIWHSVDLFIDFLNIFRHLVVILMQNQEDKKRKRSN